MCGSIHLSTHVQTSCPGYIKTLHISLLLKSLLTNEGHLKLLLFSPFTFPLSVWRSTLLPPACCQPCTHKLQSQKAPNPPEPESRARLHAAPCSLCPIHTAPSHSEATSPPAVGSLELKQWDIITELKHLITNKGDTKDHIYKKTNGFWSWYNKLLNIPKANGCFSNVKRIAQIVWMVNTMMVNMFSHSCDTIVWRKK